METVIGFIGNVFGHDFAVVVTVYGMPVVLEGYHRTLAGCLAAAQWWDRVVPVTVYCLGR